MFDINWTPESTTLRRFGLLVVLVSCAVSGWAIWQGSILGVSLQNGGGATLHVVTSLVAAYAIGASIAAPRILLPLYWLLLAIGLPVRFVIGPALLAAVFFGIITPVAVVSRAFRRDPLRRGGAEAHGTYWIERCQSEDPEDYFRPY